MFTAIVLRNLLRQRVRTALTVLGIAVGIATVFALGVVTSGLKTALGELIHGTGADFIVAQQGASDLTFSAVPEQEVTELSQRADVERADGVALEVTSLGSNPFFFVFGFEEDALPFQGVRMLSGRLPRADDAPGLAVGSDAAASHDLAVGARVVLERHAFRVVGVYEVPDAIAGPSGCGKSALLHLVAALDEPNSGAIHVAGHALERRRDPSHYRSLHVGLVFQLHNLLPSLTASENVQLPMFELQVSARERRQRAAELLGAVGLADRERSRPTQLSGGERQRVAIARALANRPPILLADEPTGSLDSEAGSNVLDLVERLRRDQGLTIVLVTHDPGVARRADRTVQMLDGRVAPVVTPAELEVAAR